jgi:hypothetical protein
MINMLRALMKSGQQVIETKKESKGNAINKKTCKMSLIPALGRLRQGES